jgi:hypothetical protein
MLSLQEVSCEKFHDTSEIWAKFVIIGIPTNYIQVPVIYNTLSHSNTFWSERDFILFIKLRDDGFSIRLIEICHIRGKQDIKESSRK